MEIRIEERSDEILFFLKAETIPEAAQLVRVGSSVVGEASGYVNYSNDSVAGWVALPLARNRKSNVMSGAKERRAR